jgi:hypothetical protein
MVAGVWGIGPGALLVSPARELVELRDCLRAHYGCLGTILPITYIVNVPSQSCKETLLYQRPTSLLI